MINNKKKKLVGLLVSLCIACLSLSCEDKLEIQQSYDFEVETLPVKRKISKGETVEINCKLKRSGIWDRAIYYVRYFQPSGAGILAYDDGMVLESNYRYPITQQNFKLFYTSQSDNQQEINLYFFDNFDKQYNLNFTFDPEEE